MYSSPIGVQKEQQQQQSDSSHPLNQLLALLFLPLCPDYYPDHRLAPLFFPLLYAAFDCNGVAYITIQSAAIRLGSFSLFPISFFSLSLFYNAIANSQNADGCYIDCCLCVTADRLTSSVYNRWPLLSGHGSLKYTVCIQRAAHLKNKSKPIIFVLERINARCTAATLKARRAAECVPCPIDAARTTACTIGRSAGLYRQQAHAMIIIDSINFSFRLLYIRPPSCPGFIFSLYCSAHSLCCWLFIINKTVIAVQTIQHHTIQYTVHFTLELSESTVITFS